MELLTTLILIGVALGISIGYSRGSTRAASARSGAELVAQVLRTAREQAMATGIPVAVAYPSQNGTTPLCQGYYLLKGEDHPEVTARVDLSKENAGLCLFLGGWLSPSGPPQGSPGKTGLAADAFSFDNFRLPETRDSVFLFTPSGALRSNGLPYIDGNYHLLVTQGARYHAGGYVPAGDPALAPNPFTLDAVCRPYTITVSPLGQVKLQEGLVGAVGVQISSDALAFQAPALPNLSGSPTSAPEIVNITLSPDPANLTLPPGIESRVPKDGYLTIALQARSPQGVPLYARVRDLTQGQPAGAISCPQWERMRFDERTGVWRHSLEWRPPPEASDTSAPFRLKCEVRDCYGNPDRSTLNTALDLEVRERKLRLTYFDFMGSGATSELRGISSIDDDSTRIRQLTHPGPGEKDRFPSWSPDGTRIAFLRIMPTTTQVWTVGEDGTGERMIVSADVLGNPCGWSPTGRQLAYLGTPNGNACDVLLVDADGANPRNLTNSAVDAEGCPAGMGGSAALQWTQDERFIVCTRLNPTLMQVIKVATNGSGITPLYGQVGALAGMPVLSPDGSFAVFQSTPSVGTTLLARVNLNDPTLGSANPASYRVLGPLTPGYCFAAVSPDNSKVFYIGRGSGLVQVNADGSNPVTLVSDPSLQASSTRLDCLDNQRVSYCKGIPNQMEIFVVDSANRIPRQISNEQKSKASGGWTR